MKFSAVVDGRRVDFNAWTGDYHIAVCKAVDLAGKSVPVTVKIWVEDLLPDYGPYEYRVETDRFGRLVVSSR